MMTARAVPDSERGEPRRLGPVRTCIGCRRRFARDAVLRCVLDDHGMAQISSSAPGRGAWICGADCLTEALARRRFDKAWRRQAPEDLGEQLRAALAASATPPDGDAAFGGEPAGR
jgi:predicted RNA-binding protein YlxR (DUF448 family)